jgi:hypothetical protein
MKRLMTFVLIALLSLGVASVSLAQQGGAAPAGGEQAPAKAEKKAAKKHAKKHKKKHKKGEQKEGEGEGMK